MRIQIQGTTGNQMGNHVRQSYKVGKEIHTVQTGIFGNEVMFVIFIFFRDTMNYCLCSIYTLYSYKLQLPLRAMRQTTLS